MTNKMPERHVSDLQYCSGKMYTKAFVFEQKLYGFDTGVNGQW